MKRLAFLIASLLGPLCLWAGCKGESITTYDAPKEAAPAEAAPMAEPAGPGTAAAPREADWDVPRGWKEQPPSEMRIGSFLAEGPDGLKADISVVVLSGDAGGDLANVNRWRGQINLDPISPAELPGKSKNISPAGRRMLLVDYLSPDLFIENRYKKRLFAAIHSRNGRTWFFKMTGEDALVRSLEPSFMSFLGSLKFHD